MNYPSTTEIAGRLVPIDVTERDLITIYFSHGARGAADTGNYAFWTIYNGDAKCTARWPEGADPGERFQAMEGEKGYEDCWEIARTADSIRPAKEEDVIKWLTNPNHSQDFRGIGVRSKLKSA